MNYLSHFVYNHEVCGLPAEPYFALGVVLPDLWLRYSRSRRIRWRAVRGARPSDPVAVQLRAGLLNHVELDRRFHTLPLFLRWQREVRAVGETAAVHPALVDFLAHAAVELALDHVLLRTAPGLVARFYDIVGQCDPVCAAQHVGLLGAVATPGLDNVIRQFVRRRFLRHYRDSAGLADVLRIVLALAELPRPPDYLLTALLAAACRCATPAAVWSALGAGANSGHTRPLID